MKIMSRVIMVVLGIAFVGFGCGHGQLTDYTYLSGAGTSGADDEGGSLISYTDPSGGSLEGGVIEPGKAIVAIFESAVASINAAMTCDGAVIDLTIVPLSDTQFSIMPTSGRFPQKTTCALSVTALGASIESASASVNKAFFTQTFEVGCDVLDNFDNPKTLDLTAASFAYGSGCWKTNYVGVPRENYDILGGMMVMDAATNPEESDQEKAPLVFKTIQGGDFKVLLDVVDMQYTFPMDPGVSDEVRVFLVLGNGLGGLIENAAEVKVVMLGYVARWDAGEDRTTYKLITGIVSGGSITTSVEYDLDDAFVPAMGFIKKGLTVTPYFSFNDGILKRFFNIEGSTSLDVSGILSGEGTLDVGFFTGANKAVNFADIFIDDFLLTGDASLVK